MPVWCMVCASVPEIAIHRVCIAMSPKFATSTICPRRRLREMSGVWPAYRIVIWDSEDFTSDEGNFIAPLEQRDRICEIKLKRFTGSQPENSCH